MSVKAFFFFFFFHSTIGFPLLQITFLCLPPQHQVAKEAVAALSSLYGTNYKYGSIITTICK